jgi:hypothetical protein
VRRRIGTTSGASGIVVSPDKKANLAEAASRIENMLDNATAAKSASAVSSSSSSSLVPTTAAAAATVPAQSPLRSTAAAPSPRTKRGSATTPAATPNNKKRATGTPAAASPLRTKAAAAADLELAQTCFEAEKAQLELQLEKLSADKNAEIERLETEFFSALFLALKLSLTEQKTRFNNKIDACDLLASARRQSVPFTTAALTPFIDRSLEYHMTATAPRRTK